MATQNPPFERDNPLSAIPVYIVGPGGASSESLLFATENISDVAAAALPGVAPAGTIFAQVSSPVAFVWRADGVAPTTAVGIAQPANTPLTISAADFAEFQAISTTVGPNALNVNYMGVATGP